MSAAENKARGLARRKENARERSAKELRGEAMDLASRLSHFARRHDRADAEVFRRLAFIVAQELRDEPHTRQSMILVWDYQVRLWARIAVFGETYTRPSWPDPVPASRAAPEGAERAAAVVEDSTPPCPPGVIDFAAARLRIAAQRQRAARKAP